MRDLKKYQTDYVNLPFESEQVRYRKRTTVESMRRYNARHILEVGCGLDPIFMHFDDFESLDIVEPSENFFRTAENAAKGRANIRLHAGTLETAASSLTDRSFDFVLVSSLLHEVENPKELLSVARSLCGDRTVVHIVVPNARSLHRLLAVEMGLIDSIFVHSDTQKTMQQHGTFDLETLADLLKSCNFSVIDSGTFFVKPFTHAQMAELSERGFLTQQMLDGLYGLTKYLPEFGSEIFVNACAAHPTR
jgi:2-polyprenyl-3-methyl-5-hydroxy-6-metoxy-1,4-benzoquinol methylase